MEVPALVDSRNVTFVCKGSDVAGQLFVPAGIVNKAVVIHAATGIQQKWYAAFAVWLARTEQAAVLTYDYRDTGRSAKHHIKQSRLRLSDWGIDDQSAALDFLCDAYPLLPVWVIGHSLGGMFVPWHRQAGRITRIIAVASGPAHFLRHPLSYMPQVLAFWFLIGPLLAIIYGYIPGRLSSFGSDLSAPAYWQWRKWCLSRGFNRHDWGKTLPIPDFGHVRAALDIISFADDRMITPTTASLLQQYYPNSAKNFSVVVPKTYGLAKIGHVNVFRERSKAVWPSLLPERRDPDSTFIEL